MTAGIFGSRIRRKTGNSPGYLTTDHKRLFPKKANAAGRIRRGQWLAEKRRRNLERTMLYELNRG